jgi:hypothetical protein
MCGEHSREILREHGFSDEAADVLVKDGAILDAPLDRSQPESGA